MTETSEQLRERSIPELMKQLSEETATLVRQEIDLAKAELTEKARRGAFGIGALGASGLLALYAVGALTAGLVAALALAVPLWAAAVIVAAGYAGAAAALAVVGRRQLGAAMPPTPQTTVKEDVRWARTRWRFGRR